MRPHYQRQENKVAYMTYPSFGIVYLGIQFEHTSFQVPTTETIEGEMRIPHENILDMMTPKHCDEKKDVRTQDGQDDNLGIEKI